MICIHCLGTGGSFPAFWLFLALKPSRISLTLCAIFTGGPYSVSGQKHRERHGKTMDNATSHGEVKSSRLFTLDISSSLWDESVPINACEHALPLQLSEDVQKSLSEKWRCQAPHLEVVQKNIFQDDRMSVKSLRICPGTKGLRYQRSRSNLNVHKRA